MHPFLNRKQGATDIFLIRHADALPEPNEVVPGGSYDFQPISGRGRQQSEALAERWGALKFDTIYSSPLSRTIETATPLATKQGLEIIQLDDIREIFLGPDHVMLTQDMSAEETAQALRTRNEKIVMLAATAGSWDAVPAAEPSALFRQRIVRGVDGIAQRHPGERVAVFSHGGAINIYVAEVLGMNRDFFFPCANTSVTVIRVDGQTQPHKRVLITLNEVSHLRDAGLLQE